jgi:hypothetical protein
MTTIQNLPSTDVLNAGDQFAVVSNNGRTKQIAASDMATYFNAALKGASIQFDLSSSVITMTLGDGFVTTGTVTP